MSPPGRRVHGEIQMRAVDAKTKQISTIVVLGILGVIAVAMFLVCILRAVRQRHKEPKYIPTTYLRRLWTGWNPTSYTAEYHRTGHDLDDDSISRPSRVRIGSTAREGGGAELLPSGRSNGGAASGRVPDRQTSIRSIMTLPPYRVDAAHTEQVIGREGERDGVDVVVEMPTEEDMEGLRDDEMEALYQIRLARRRENAQREERRQLRRIARDRGDLAAIEELRTRARGASDTSSIDDLRENHERLREQRNRAVSSVSYSNLGIARHDGSRLRANSAESTERVGLLSDAASIALSTSTTGGASGHRRNRSSSVLSGDSDFRDPAMESQSRASSRAETIRLSTGHSPSASISIEVTESDLADADMPPHSPPGYEDVEQDDISRAATPQNEPPPNYPGPAPTRSDSEPSNDGQAHDRGRQASRSGQDGVPRLPSLRFQGLPQIVIDSSNDSPVRRGGQ